MVQDFLHQQYCGDFEQRQFRAQATIQDCKKHGESRRVKESIWVWAASMLTHIPELEALHVRYLAC